MTTKSDVLSTIRQKCLDCCCGQPGEVRNCRIEACALWPFRFGSDPQPSATRGFAARLSGDPNRVTPEQPAGTQVMEALG